MPYDLSDPARPRRRAASGPFRRPAIIAPPGHDSRPLPPVLEGIGDIVLAGHSTGYPHLATRGASTAGHVAACARDAAASLSRPALWPRRRGRWQPAPRSARRGANGRIRVTVVALEPNQFVEIPVEGGRPAALHLVYGRTHVVSTTKDGSVAAIQRLLADHTRVLATEREGERWLLNTGDRTAVVARAIGG